MIQELVTRSRSYRRFDSRYTIDMSFLRDLVILARFSPSAANRQPLKFLLSCDSQTNDLIFPTLSWAAYLPDWNGPAPEERPSAYVVILGDLSIHDRFGCDLGIAAQSMMLGAAEKGLGGCMIAHIDHDRLRTSLHIEDRYEILLVLALGKPAEEVILEDVESSGDIRYWRDPEGRHHVPKRKLEDLILQVQEHL
ncbi:MAG TPA: nitroreductase family protein [Thermoanaerobaculia bacterium]|nr:nitroreductase family protein [Thermoanaerobaculia bacterium]HUM30444.1 nitroreductase family protein [Thermoanaerobaculia bacterium]HXK68689.1 nitroreductase family protein [Thermoanaerobaculia bacterium]